MNVEWTPTFRSLDLPALEVRVRPPPSVGHEIAATGGFSACDITRTLLYKITREREDMDLLEFPRKGNEECWGPLRPSLLLVRPLHWVGGWDYYC